MAAKKKYIGETPEQRKARLLQYQKDYYQAHKEARREYMRKWVKEYYRRSDSMKMSQKKYKQKNRYRIAARKAAWYAAKQVNGMLIREKAEILDMMIDDGAIDMDIVNAYKERVRGEGIEQE